MSIGRDGALGREFVFVVADAFVDRFDVFGLERRLSDN